MEENRIVTRKDEVRFTTSDMRKALGKFLRKAVKKTYQEDFIDESTGETLTIDRHELLFEAGQQITQDLAARIQFSINAGEIAQIEVSNQHRQATAYAYDRLQPWKVTAGINGQRKSFLLQAQSAQKAIEVATDYIELNSVGAFNIVGVKSLGGVIVLDAPLRKVEKQTRLDTLAPPAELTDEEAREYEARKEEEGSKTHAPTTFYNIVAQTIFYDSLLQKNVENVTKFLVRASDVEIASAVATTYINRRIEKVRLERPDDPSASGKTSIIAATQFPINAVILKEFCMAYFDEYINDTIE